jgi:hypothetical protein
MGPRSKTQSAFFPFDCLRRLKIQRALMSAAWSLDLS